MADYGTTKIQTAAVHVAGDVVGNVDLTSIGKPDMTAHVMVGSVLARIGDRRAAQRLAATWREAALHLHRIPERVGLSGPGRPDAECPAGLVIRIGRDAAARQDLLPADPPRRPGRLRIQVGPLVWVVLDRAAYTSMRELWERVESLL